MDSNGSKANNLTIEGLDAAYGAVRVLEGVSLNVRSGETVVLLGTNGNGKSTLDEMRDGHRAAERGPHHGAEIDGVSHDPWLAARPRRSSISESHSCRKAAACFRA